MTQPRSESLSQKTGVNSLMLAAQPIAPPQPVRDSELIQQQLSKLALSEAAVFPKRKRVLEVSKNDIAQVQRLLAQYRNNLADQILTVINSPHLKAPTLHTETS
jgi:hypothetical protein